MKTVFADTSYWVAKINPLDQWHSRVIEVEYEIGIVKLITSSEQIVIETLNYFSKYNPKMKKIAAVVMREISASDEIEIIKQSGAMLTSGIDLYESRIDKGYSLTDCISMNIMREHEITDVLTGDKHFRQEGFVPLF